MEGRARPRFGAGPAAERGNLKDPSDVRTEALLSRYPVLYHMAEDGSWESIKRLGLLSTTALLDKFGVEERFAIESARRPEIVRVEHPEYGCAAFS